MARRREGYLVGVLECVNKNGGIFDEEDREAIELLSSVLGGILEVLLLSEARDATSRTEGKG